MLIKKYLETAELNFKAQTKQITVDSTKQDCEQLWQENFQMLPFWIT